MQKLTFCLSYFCLFVTSLKLQPAEVSSREEKKQPETLKPGDIKG